MNPLAFGLALSAAVLHVVWNLVVKGSGDRLVAAFTVSGLGALFYLPALMVTGLPDRDVWGLIGVSSVVQTVYMILLAKAYEHGEMSFVYPIARGVAPVLVTIAGVTWLDDSIRPLGVLGVLAVTGALVMLASGRADRDGLGWALATGLAIAVYTTIDAAASRRQGSAIPVLGSMFVIHATLLGVYARGRRGPGALLGVFKTYPGRSLVAGAGSAGGYLLVMTAAVMAPVGPVTAVRETSVVLGVLAGRRLLAERVGMRQWWAVGVSVTGVILLALSR